MYKKPYLNPRLVMAFFLLVFSIPVSASRAVAMSQPVSGDFTPYDVLRVTPSTPYPTLTPIIATATLINPLAGLDRSCPVGVPAGYGSVTPSSDWLAMCGECLPDNTPIPMYTSTAGATRTPVFITNVPFACMTASASNPEYCNTPVSPPTSTSTAFPTPFNTSTPAGLPSHGSMVMSCNAPTVPNISGSASLTYPNDYSCLYTFTNFRHSNGVFSQPLRMSSGTVGTPSLHNPSGMVAYDFWGAYDLNFQYEIDLANTDNPERYPFTVTAVFDVVYALLPADITYTNYLSVSGQSWQYTQSPVFFDDNSTSASGWTAGGSSQWSNDVIVNGTVVLYYEGYSPLNPPTPTPTSTGTPDPRYCSSVSSAELPNPFSFNGSGNVVAQKCAVIPAITPENIINVLFPSTWLSPLRAWFDSLIPDNAYIPPLTICVRERDYSLYLFGIRMPIEFIFSLVVFLSALRMFAPSLFSGASIIGRSFRDGDR